MVLGKRWIFSIGNEAEIWPLWMGRKSPIRYILYGMVFRAYPGSEFVVAKTLAKWKKLEPNKIDCSQVLARK